MNRLLKDAKEKKFNIVLFWALSRFTRSVSDLYNTMENFQKWGIDMISYTESFDTSTSMGRAMIGIVGVFSQLERELTSERVSAALSERASQRKRTCSEILGYDLDGKDSFKINENEAEYVRFCFNEYLLRKIYQRLLTKQINVDLKVKEERNLLHGLYKRFLREHNIVDLTHSLEKYIRETMNPLLMWKFLKKY